MEKNAFGSGAVAFLMGGSRNVEALDSQKIFSKHLSGGADL